MRICGYDMDKKAFYYLKNKKTEEQTFLFHFSRKRVAFRVHKYMRFLSV